MRDDLDVLPSLFVLWKWALIQIWVTLTGNPWIYGPRWVALLSVPVLTLLVPLFYNMAALRNYNLLHHGLVILLPFTQFSDDWNAFILALWYATIFLFFFFLFHFVYALQLLYHLTVVLLAMGRAASKQSVFNIIVLPALFLFTIQAYVILPAETDPSHKFPARIFVSNTAIWVLVWFGHNLKVSLLYSWP